tara:strand:- start:5 stop:199 length:195 start_codon:yes stop_codon:yes gene_type:complete
MIPVWEFIVIAAPTLTLPSNVEIPVTKKSLIDAATPTKEVAVTIPAVLICLTLKPSESNTCSPN